MCANFIGEMSTRNQDNQNLNVKTPRKSATKLFKNTLNLGDAALDYYNKLL